MDQGTALVETKETSSSSSGIRIPLPVVGSGGEEGELAFSFGAFRLLADGTLLRGESVVHLPPRELAALRLLASHAGQVVTSLQLRKALWGDVHVTADSIPKCLSSLRTRLEPEVCIQTVYKRGYRFIAEVRRLSEPPSQPLPRLAIMPFVSGYTVPAYLGSVIAEETISRLTGARPESFAILARDSVFILAARGLTAQQVGEALKADLVLTGTLRNLPSHFRLRAEMIRVEDGTQVWVEDVLVPQSQIDGLELELIERLVFRLNSCGFSISAAAEPESENDSNPHRREAREIYQRAHYEWRSLQRHRMQDSQQLLLRATELDPNLIAAKVELSRLCITQAVYGFIAPSVAANLVHRAADSIPDLHLRAQALLPSLGVVSFNLDHDLPTAHWAFSSSAHLPHDPWVTRSRVMFSVSRHRFNEAIELLQAALMQDPLSPWIHGRLAWALHLAGKAAESVEQIHRGLTLFPGHEEIAFYGAMILPYNGHAPEGIQLAESLAARQPQVDMVAALQAYALACDGRRDQARDILERLEWLSRERFVLSSFTPAVYVALDEPEAALLELRRSADTRCPWFFQMLADPRLKPLHGRPEFEELRAILARVEAQSAEA
ncbi:MAG: winged helix-turn-helix domain-containing protein [Terracidiphilus sp.]|jgi:DNA-binding winged helix-turn-helix (wHTH) protein